MFAGADRLEPLGQFVRPWLQPLAAAVKALGVGLIETLEASERNPMCRADPAGHRQCLVEQGLVLRSARYLRHAAKPLDHVDSVPGRAVEIVLMVMLDTTAHLGRARHDQVSLVICSACPRQCVPVQPPGLGIAVPIPARVHEAAHHALSDSVAARLVFAPSKARIAATA